ncbi:Cancer/testis antigen 1 [Camelus dromedarius]|uniref:Cancer/testis antigen 1 n=1 Tax=Camelus dromedarius TaxID=9838 RepID=A0A5N4C1F3_CAMDR|nr:Cancer/testis antigen 1 [Camelus dromedarius]
MVQPVAFPRLSGHPRHQGLVEMQHPRLEVRVISCFSWVVWADRGWQCFFTVPFPSPVEAEIAHWFLTPNVELQGPVQEEFSVNGSVLAVSVLQWAGEGLVAGGQSQSPPSRLTAEDPGQLRTSIASCLDQLFLVMQAMQCFVPPSFAQPQQGKGG